MSQSILVGKGNHELRLLTAMTNRHGLIAGATGTGKTVTLRVLAEGLSRLGVSTFMPDVKGDLAGICQPGAENPKFVERAKELGVPGFAWQGAPVTFWDVFGAAGHPVRTTISEMGPLLLARLLDLNDTQTGVLNVVFKAADEQGLLLLDLKDLQAMVRHVSENAKEYSAKYGNVSPASAAAIQRALLALSEQGAEQLFGEPALLIGDLMRTDTNGRGMVNILAADKLMTSPKLYSTFLLWMLAELFEQLPEVGDLPQPKLVFFFDEAHLLFDEAPKVVIDKIEQLVRLIRSKGVGVVFCTQNPLDVPDEVLGQLGNRVQHALRAFTPRDQKAVRAAAETFRNDGSIDVEEILTQLAVGEALVSFLDEHGSPVPVERGKIVPPASRLGPISESERRQLLSASPLGVRYATAIDRESAYEMLKVRAEQELDEDEEDEEGVTPRRGTRKSTRQSKTPRTRKSTRATPIEAMATSAARSLGTQIGGKVGRGLLGMLTGFFFSRDK